MTEMKIMCEGKLVNKHSDGGRYNGWGNPIETIPPVGSIIDYMTFDEPNYKNGEGVLTSYKVTSIRFYTREAVNHSYKDKACVIEVEKIS